jgi:hypothetical protein
MGEGQKTLVALTSQLRRASLARAAVCEAWVRSGPAAPEFREANLRVLPVCGKLHEGGAPASGVTASNGPLRAGGPIIVPSFKWVGVPSFKRSVVPSFKVWARDPVFRGFC